MALIIWDGLDPYASLAEFRNCQPRVLTGTSEVFQTTSGRFNGCRLYVDGNTNDAFKVDISDINASQIWTGRASYHQSAYSATNVLLFVARSNTGIEASVTADSDGTVKVYKGDRGTLIANSASGVFLRDQWTWLDIFYNMDATTGGVEVWINNSRVVNLTNANTKNFGNISNNVINSVTIATNQYGSSDDFYILNTTGSAPWNTRLGDSRVVNLIPITDFGANSGTPSTGTAHYAVIDDSRGTTDYLSIPVTNGTSIERFVKNTSPLGANATILAVGPYNYSRKSDAGIANLRSLIINNSSGYFINGNLQITSTSWQPYVDFYTTNPETGTQWTYDTLSTNHIALVVTK